MIVENKEEVVINTIVENNPVVTVDPSKVLPDSLSVYFASNDYNKLKTLFNSSNSVIKSKMLSLAIYFQDTSNKNHTLHEIE